MSDDETPRFRFAPVQWRAPGVTGPLCVGYQLMDPIDRARIVTLRAYVKSSPVQSPAVRALDLMVIENPAAIAIAEEFMVEDMLREVGTPS